MGVWPDFSVGVDQVASAVGALRVIVGVLAVAGLTAGAGAWAVGASTGDVRLLRSGRRASGAALLAALLAGAAPPLLGFLLEVGGRL